MLASIQTAESKVVSCHSAESGSGDDAATTDSAASVVMPRFS
jgi:hypothetical protein